MLSTSGPWTFTNLIQTTATASPRTFDIYLELPPPPARTGKAAIRQAIARTSGAGRLRLTPPTRPRHRWRLYFLGTVTLAATDTNTSVTLTENSGTVPQDACSATATNSLTTPTARWAGQLEQKTVATAGPRPTSTTPSARRAARTGTPPPPRKARRRRSAWPTLGRLAAVGNGPERDELDHGHRQLHLRHGRRGNERKRVGSRLTPASS